MKNIRLLLCSVLLVGLAWGCQLDPESLETHRQPVVYGPDDRTDVVKHPNTTLRKLADSVAAILSSSRIDIDDDTGKVTINADPLTTKIQKSSNYDGVDLCPEEPFRDEPAPGSCTGFLIGPRLLATAGHCVYSSSPKVTSAASAQARCNTRRILFGYYKDANGKLPAYTEDDVYRCRRVLVYHYADDPKLDLGVIELDRDVKGRSPLAIDLKPSLKAGDALAVIGHPHGIPMKIATGAVVADPRTSTMDYFTTNLDTSPGNSGSPVFLLSSGKVVGVHVRGARPVFNLDKDRKCSKTNTLEASAEGKQSANYLNRSTPPPCQSSTDCAKEFTCENKQCILQTTDLRVTKFEISSSTPQRDGPLKAEFTILNEGTYSITQRFRVGLWWSTNSTICPTCNQDILLASVEIPALKPNQSHNGSFSILLQAPFTLGKQFIGIYADDMRRSSSGDRASRLGMVPELDDYNNYSSKEINVVDCPSDCAKEDDKTCQDNKVVVCKTQSDGCLRWQTLSTCEEHMDCVQGECKARCEHKCPQADALRCLDKQTQRCTKQANGCRDWTTLHTCDDTQLCQDGACIPKPLPLGTPCQNNAQCESKTCAGPKPYAICTSACSQHADCKDKTYPFCLDGSCQPLPINACIPNTHPCPAKHDCTNDSCLPWPAGKCEKNEDCASQETCVEGQCKAPQGCSCSSNPSTPPLTPLLLLLLLLPLRRLLTR